VGAKSSTSCRSESSNISLVVLDRQTEESEMEVEGESARDNPPAGERRKRKERNEHGMTVGPPEKR
jgi:hypothetical protein